MLNRGIGATKDAADNINNGFNKAENATVAGITTNGNNNGSGYTATRTNATGSFLGMGEAAWTWLIIGIVTVAIVALVLFYGRQVETQVNPNE